MSCPKNWVKTTQKLTFKTPMIFLVTAAGLRLTAAREVTVINKNTKFSPSIRVQRPFGQSPPHLASDVYTIFTTLTFHTVSSLAARGKKLEGYAPNNLFAEFFAKFRYSLCACIRDWGRNLSICSKNVTKNSMNRST